MDEITTTIIKMAIAAFNSELRLPPLVEDGVDIPVGDEVGVALEVGVGRDVPILVAELIADVEAEAVTPPVVAGPGTPDVCAAGKLTPEDQVVGAAVGLECTVKILPLKPSWFGVLITSVS
jgi:hypothetical protein